jgi:F-type H+-transporting ATPase subunit b
MAAGMPDGTILSLDKSLIFYILIQLLNAVILIIALIFILYKPVRNFLAARKQRVVDEIEDARRIREEAEQLKAAYEKMLEGVEAERDEILLRTNQIAVDKSDQLLFEARHEAEIIHNRVKTDIETEYKNMQDDIKRQIIEISHLMASRFVQVNIDRESQDKLIEQALAEWDAGGSIDAESYLSGLSDGGAG